MRLRELVWPIYAPVLLASIGTTALVPLVPLIALELGFSVPAAAALTLITGIVSVLGPIPASRVMTVVGERMAMITTGIGLAVFAMAGFGVVAHGLANGPGALHRVGLVLVLFTTAVCQQVWHLGRQSYMGTHLPVEIRARGMSTLGGMMRIGQVIGPVLGAGVVVFTHEGWVFVLEAVMALAAVVLVAWKMLPADKAEDVRRASVREVSRTTIPDDPSPYAPGRPAIRTMVLAGIGVIPLSMSRINRPLILPLLGAALGLDSATISLIFGVAAAVEITMFVPAGTIMDRRGRTAVVVPSLVISGLGFVLLAVLAQTIGGTSHTGALVAVASSAVLVGLGNGLSSGIVMTLGVDLSPERFRTRHIARWNTITSVGHFLGPGLVSGITLFAHVALAGLATGVLCMAGGAWLWRFLPGVTPVPTRGQSSMSGTNT